MTDKLREAAQQVLEKIAKAHTKIDALCLGNERWTMSVPIRPDHDHDLVISGALYAAAEFIRSALAEQPAEQNAEHGEPVAWEWRWFDTSPYTVASWQWSDWKRVEPRNQLCTVEDSLNELRSYIDRGQRYELRALYTAPQPAIPPGYKLVPVEPTPEMKTAGIAVEVYPESKPEIGALTWAEVKAIYSAMLAAAPEAPKPAKQPLTDEEIDALELPPSGTATVRDLVRLIERAHGITKE